MTCVGTAVLALMMLQYPYPARRIPNQGPATAQGANVDAVATFDGTFKSVTKKFLTIEVENGNTVQLYVTGSTKFIRDGKRAKPAEFHRDEPVAVDASRDARMNLLAVKVEAIAPAKAPGGTTAGPGGTTAGPGGTTAGTPQP